jgi:hypothetical protein
MVKDLAEVRCSCGRYFLSVAGIAVAMEGDSCREANVPEDLWGEIPTAELAQATIGSRPAAELPTDVVRFFRGGRWNEDMLRWAAETINRSTDGRRDG